MDNTTWKSFVKVLDSMSTATNVTINMITLAHTSVHGVRRPLKSSQAQTHRLKSQKCARSTLCSLKFRTIQTYSFLSIQVSRYLKNGTEQVAEWDIFQKLVCDKTCLDLFRLAYGNS